MAVITPSGGSNLNSVPAPVKQTLSSNYIDFTASGTAGWAQQYLPDLMEAEAEVFGKRTISGFLEMVGAEEAMTSDQVIWSEQGRLHIKLAATVTTAASGLITFGSAHEIRVGDTILVHKAAATLKCYVSAVPSATTITALPYAQATLATGSSFANADSVTVLVYGSEFAKGVAGRTEAIEPSFKSFTNKPIIIKVMYQV